VYVKTSGRALMALSGDGYIRLSAFEREQVHIEINETDTVVKGIVGNYLSSRIAELKKQMNEDAA